MNAPLADTTIVEAEKDVFSCELAGGQALLDLRSSTYYSINSVGSHIWELIRTPTSIGDIQRSVLDAFEVEADRARADIQALIGQLAEAGLVKVRNDKAA